MLGFQIIGEDGERARDDFVPALESVVADAQLPLVPQRRDHLLFLRPQGN